MQRSMKFIDHVRELRQRALYVVFALIAGTIAGYALQPALMATLTKPLQQKLYYTSPAGGFSFMMSLCLLFGILTALPVAVYHTVQFIAPALSNRVRIWVVVALSVALAVLGVGFAYYLSLPAALSFLAHVGSGSITPLLSANEYIRFVSMYLLSFALLFQLPVLVAIAYTIRPFGPGGMMRYQRHMIAASFIVAAILTPTPDPINQFIMAAPTIALYQIAVMYVWLRHRPETLVEVQPQGQMPLQPAPPQCAPTTAVTTTRIAAAPVPSQPVAPAHAVERRPMRTQAHKAPRAPHLIQDVARPQAALSQAPVQ